jgi:hypothetical protein
MPSFDVFIVLALPEKTSSKSVHSRYEPFRQFEDCDEESGHGR